MTQGLHCRTTLAEQQRDKNWYYRTLSSLARMRPSKTNTFCAKQPKSKNILSQKCKDGESEARDCMSNSAIPLTSTFAQLGMVRETKSVRASSAAKNENAQSSVQTHPSTITRGAAPLNSHFSNICHFAQAQYLNVSTATQHTFAAWHKSDKSAKTSNTVHLALRGAT